MGPIALYIHRPFFVSKCPYRDFNSHVRAQVDVAAWQAALLADMAHEAALVAAAERHWGIAELDPAQTQAMSHRADAVRESVSAYLS